MEEGAPAATPDSVVFFDHPLKVEPCLLSEFLDLKSRCGLPSAFRVRPFVSSGFFFCLQSEFLFVFDLFLFYLLVEVAPVAARDDELVDLELRMNALCPVKQISVERILYGKPDAG